MSKVRVNAEFWKDLNNVIEKSLVPRYENNTARPCNEEDFREYRTNLKECLQSIESMLDVIVQNDQWTLELNNYLLKVLIIICEQHYINKWNTKEIVNLSLLLEPKICKIFKKNSLSDIFGNEQIITSTILLLRPKLLKETWQSYPGSVVCYKRILELVQKPLLKRLLPEVLPTALIIVDDYVTENQRIGLDCLCIIIQHCESTKALKNLNYDHVILETLQRMAHKETLSLIIPLYLCISSLLNIMEYCKDVGEHFKWSNRDDVLIILLGNMESQNNYQARYDYMTSLKQIVNHSSCGKWSERIARIISEYCEDNTNLQVSSLSLEFLQYFLSIYQPKSTQFYVIMYTSLLKLSYHIILSEKKSKELAMKTKECFLLLNKLYPYLGKKLSSNNKIYSVIEAL